MSNKLYLYETLSDGTSVKTGEYDLDLSRPIHMTEEQKERTMFGYKNNVHGNYLKMENMIKNIIAFYLANRLGDEIKNPKFHWETQDGMDITEILQEIGDPTSLLILFPKIRFWDTEIGEEPHYSNGYLLYVNNKIEDGYGLCYSTDYQYCGWFPMSDINYQGEENES